MGQPARTTDDLGYDQAARASAAVVTARTAARQKVVRAIRDVESRLIAALEGDVLRGVVNLVPGDLLEPYQAVRVNGDARFGIDSYLPSDGRPVLVIEKTGHLAMAWVEQGRGVVDGRPHFFPTVGRRPVRDDELQAQDLEPLARAVRAALDRHVQRAERTARSYERAGALAARIARALF